ncbi:RidA family protein [Streptomyces nigra]|jgi:2-iminobutanoate/2-iminopropanoate deaminase|uniref:RidA family protein n=1 Tax=Streptomyces nigra TaxID=1827580 RepID=UPI0034463571
MSSVPHESYEYGVPWESAFGYSQAVRAGNTLYVSGQLSHDESGTFIGSGDFELQVRSTLQNLDRVLDHYGAARNQIVETTVLVKELRKHFDTVARLHAEYCGENRPTSTVMGVSELALPQQLIEIGAVVRLDLES